MQKIIAASLLLFIPLTVNAATVTMSATTNNVLTVSFDLPVQPASHNAIQLGVWSSSGPSFARPYGQISLSEGGTEIGNGEGFAGVFGGRLTSPDSFFVGTGGEIDYLQVADGISGGVFEYRLKNGQVSFDTDDLFVRTFGDGGSSGFDGVISNVAVSTVPIPAAIWLFGSALVVLGTIKRRKRYREYQST